jgi:hypothetical protein
MAARAALAWSSRDIGRDDRVLAAICARRLIGRPTTTLAEAVAASLKNA